ncbi:SGNH/GDSL hydrolase family protein [Candidatus Omnitrophota bacterium]
MKQTLKIIFINGLIVVLFFECLIGILLAVPSLSQGPLYRFMSAFYRYDNIRMPQYEEAMSLYDSELTYTLKPNATFYFSNPEFNTKFTTNSQGLRDTETSLQEPEIICIGDSYTMGWGVEQQEAFPQVLSSLTGKSILNAGVSSYGSVREMKLLDRLDTSNLRYLIIQYDGNDYPENNVFYNTTELPIMNNSTYNDVKKIYRNRIRYYPGKHFLFALVYLKGVITKTPISRPRVRTYFRKEQKSKSSETQAFLNALMNASSVDLTKVQLLFFASKKFINELKDEVNKSPYPDYIKNALYVPKPTKYKYPEFHFIIDGHLNAKGHAFIAKQIAQKLNLTTN